MKVNKSQKLTAGSLWKITTRPPLSPVANKSPSWLNSTQDMMSAKKYQKKGQFCTQVTEAVSALESKGCCVLDLPSVTSSSNVPFTCEKHHWMSLEPGKIILELKICIQGRPTLSRQSRPFKGLASTVEDFAGSTYRPFCWRETFKPRPTYDLGDFYGFCKGGEKEWPKTHHETIFVKYFIPVLYTHKINKRFQKTPNFLVFPSKQKIVLVTMRTAVAADSAWAGLSTWQSLPPFTNGAKVST